jgi:hypothetical protein
MLPARPHLVLALVCLALSATAPAEILRETVVPINFDAGQPISGGLVVADFSATRIEPAQIRMLTLRVRAQQEGQSDRAGLWDWDAGDAGYVMDISGDGWQTAQTIVPPPYSRWAINGTGFARPQFVYSVLPEGTPTTTYLARVELHIVYVPVCVADYDNGSGLGFPDLGVTIDDLVFYLALFGEGDAQADVDDGSGTGTQDQGVTIDDLIFFLDHYQAGC